MFLCRRKDVVVRDRFESLDEVEEHGRVRFLAARNFRFGRVYKAGPLGSLACAAVSELARVQSPSFFYSWPAASHPHSVERGEETNGSEASVRLGQEDSEHQLCEFRPFSQQLNCCEYGG